MFNILRYRNVPGTGALRDQRDIRDLRYEPIAKAGEPVDWNKGFDVEQKLNITVPIKSQNGSGSCVGQGWSYYGAVLNAAEVKFYDEQSAKAIYSQIQLGQPGGGAYIRDGAKLFVNWGSVRESIVPSYDNGKPPTELFMKDKLWKTPEIDQLAKLFQAKEYRTFSAAQNMELFAQAIRDNHGVVGGVEGSKNGTWMSGEPKPPIGRPSWAHCLWWGKFGIDAIGKYIASPNSWNTRKKDELHPDGWQKFREEWFQTTFMFNPWTLIDKPNVASADIAELIINVDKGLVIENEAPGRKGIIYGGKLMEVANGREGNAAIYLLESKGAIRRVSKAIFDQIPKGNNF